MLSFSVIAHSERVQFVHHRLGYSLLPSEIRPQGTVDDESAVLKRGFQAL
jgi:hypothetical protein